MFKRLARAEGSTANWTLFVLLSLVGLVAISSAAQPESLPRQLASLIVVNGNAAENGVQFIPTQAILVDVQGRPTNSPQLNVVAADKVMISGRLSYVADPRDVDTLQSAARQVIGNDSKLTSVKPRSFAVWAKLDGRTVWSRPHGEGEFEKVVFQFLATVPREKREIEIELLTFLTWSEKTAPVGGTIQVNFRSLIQRIQEEQHSVSTNEDTIKQLVQRAVQEKWVRVDSSDADPGRVQAVAAEILASRLVGAFLTPAEPGREAASQPSLTTQVPATTSQGSSSSFVATYQLKQAALVEDRTTSIDMSVASVVTRTGFSSNTVRFAR